MESGWELNQPPQPLERRRVVVRRQQLNRPFFDRLTVNWQWRLAEAEKCVNIDQFLKFWPMETLLGFWDGYTKNQNNYYAYCNPKDNGRFHFVPWGADGAFTEGRGPFSRFGGDDDAPESVYSQSMLANRL